MEPIIALATPPLKSALALIRLSGDGVFDAVAKAMGFDAEEFSKRRIRVGYLGDKGKPIDEVVAFIFPNPNSFTGEDVVELSCHGSMIIVREILSYFYGKGIRQAERGEFSARAFYNGKVDLIEAEAINDLINATTKESKDLALLSLKGETSSLLSPIASKIDEMLALIEVNIDYPEYTDIEETNLTKVRAECQGLVDEVDSLIAGGRQGKVVREGVKVALVGEPNVGKSSLLNALLDEEKAIVTPIPGTTRDVVEGVISLRGIPLRLLDTAGIRESDDVVESIGIKKSVDSIKEADLVIVVHDDKNEEITNELEGYLANKTVIHVQNKADLLGEEKRVEGRVYVSALNKEIGALKDAIYDVLGVSDEAYKTPSFSNERELGLLLRMKEALEESMQLIDAGATVDFVSSGLQSARLCANELLGKEVSTDLSDEIFSRFCVGK